MLEPFVTLVAAFAGAWAAFHFNRWQEAKSRDERRIEALNRALFSLGAQLNELQGIRKQYIDPVRDHPARHFAMRPMFRPESDRIQLELGELTFLLNTEDRNLLLGYMIERSRYAGALGVLEERSRLHIEEAQARFEAVGIKQGEADLAEVEKAAGPKLTHTLKSLTDDAVEAVDKGIETHKALFRELRAAGLRVYPNAKLIKLAEDATPN